YFHVPGSRTLQDNLKVVWNNSSTIDMINYRVKHGKIDLYVEYEIGVVFTDDESMLVVACLQFDGDMKGFRDGGESDDAAVCEGGESDRGGEEGVDVVVKEGGESDRGGEKGVRDENDSDSKDENAYLMKVIYLSDGDDDEEFQEARRKVREMERKTNGKGKETILNETESESFEKQFKAKVPKEVDGGGVNDSVSKEEDGNEIEYFDSDDHKSILGSEDDGNTDVYGRRSRFPTYNPNLASPRFCIRMLFKDGEQFKLKFVKSFHNEHNYCVSFGNKMVNVKVIVEHFKATIRDHLKMKLREIQRKIASEMHVNVNMTRCKRAKKMVKDKLAGNFVQEFSMLWDHADELRLKNSGSTIKMALNRVSPESPPHFKRFYVYFETLKGGWKEGCKPILGLDGCFLKGPFKAELLTIVGKDGNNQMYPVAWAIVKGECIDSWAWFLSLFTANLGMEDGFGYTIINDQQKGLDIAINDILPKVEHRNYASHVLSNWSSRKKAKTFEFAFWKVMKSTTEREWEQKKEDLYKLDEGVAKELKTFWYEYENYKPKNDGISGTYQHTRIHYGKEDEEMN
ncbi:hypothetical protein J1N35_022169, partial [Gossypium stocksii]